MLLQNSRLKTHEIAFRGQISKHFPGGGGGGNARYWNEPRSRYEAGSAPGYSLLFLYSVVL